MTTAVQRRRGTATEHSSFTGLEGELSVNTTNESVHVHDGSTAGGFELARADASNIVATSIDINGGTIDGTTIGASSASTGAFTTLTATGLNASGTAVVGGLQARATGNIEVGGYNGGTDYGLILTPADGSTWWHMYNDAGGHLAFGHSGTVGSAEKMRIDSSGNLLVGTTDPNPLDNTSGNGVSIGTSGVEVAIANGEALYLNRMGSDGRIVNFRKAGSFVAGIDVTSTTVTYNTSSDQRLKENIADAPSASDDIDAIQVRSFDWKADGSHQKYGMIAQELQTVAPEAVSGDADSEEMMGVDYSKLVPMLIKEIQSLRNRVAQLEE